MNSANKIIYTISLIVSIIVFQFWDYLKECYGIKIFYPGIALLFLSFTWIVWRETSGRFRVFCEAFFWLAVNNFLDELFFDPTIIEAREYIAFIAILINLVFQWKRNSKN